MSDLPPMIKTIIDIINESNLNVLFSFWGLILVFIIFFVFLFLSLARFENVGNKVSRLFCRIFLYALPLTALMTLIILSLVIGIRFGSEIKDRQLLFEYQNSDPEIALLELDIENKYGIRTYTNFDIDSVFHRKAVRYKTDVDKEDAIIFLKELRYVLSQYSEEAISILPKHMFLVTDLIKIDGEVEAEGVNCGNFIAFDATRYYDDNDFGYLVNHPRVIHHEFFHSLDELMSKDQLDRFEKDSESCLLTSDYACSEKTEFLADAWCSGIALGMNNKHIEILQELNEKLLKDPENEIESISLSDLDAQGLEDQKMLIKALDHMIENDLSKICIKDVKKLEDNALINLKSCLSDKLLSDSINAYFYNDDLVICVQDELLEQMRDDRNKVRELSASIINNDEDLDDYEKAEKIYRYFTKGIDDTYFKDNYAKNLLISAVLNGNNIYALTDGLLINARYEDHNYWLGPFWEDKEVEALYYFMIDDRFRSSFHEEVPPYFPKCDDNTKSYLYLNELYLDEFDEEKIIDYIYREYSKGLNSTELYIACENKELTERVKDYLLNKEDGHTLLQRLYNDDFLPSGWSFYYPGYQSQEYGCILHIYNFE